MAVSTLVRIDKMVAGTPALDISQTKSQSTQTGNEQLNEQPGGHLYPMFTGPMEQKPVYNFQTTQLDTLLGSVGIGGAALVNADLYQKVATSVGSTARLSLAHNRFRMAEGIIYWTSINLNHNEVSTVDVVCAANFDGSNAPIVATGSLALAGNLTNTLNFGMGPGSLNGTSLPGIKSVTIDSGIALTQEGAASEVFPTFTGIQDVVPTATVTLLEPVAFNTYSIATTGAGVALNGSTGLTFYARKMSNVGRVTDITAEHIKFVAANGTAIPTESQGSGTEPMTDTLTVHLSTVADSAVPLVITTSSAIT